MLPVDRSFAVTRHCADIMFGFDGLEFALSVLSDIIVGSVGLIGVDLSMGDGAYTMTESGVSVRTSTGSRRSCSNGSRKGSLASEPFADARLNLSGGPYGESGG
jgi:hypothetical protein